MRCDQQEHNLIHNVFAAHFPNAAYLDERALVMRLCLQKNSHHFVSCLGIIVLT